MIFSSSLLNEEITWQVNLASGETAAGEGSRYWQRGRGCPGMLHRPDAGRRALVGCACLDASSLKRATFLVPSVLPW